ncbi:hypothetical protein [Verrucosispora sp. ts21]|uniref:hypothetical protein n=1 Tax=Verrucosispora sp. ts21 TaxID=2069341 RepID=UPI0011AFA0BF|nr:hypothetical protein [Verrucosispora sp. ts21]
MDEQEEVLADLKAAGVLAGLQWARRSAYQRTWRDYEPETGHDQTTVGTIAHKLMCDRLDRVFSCGKYFVESPEQADAGLDIVAAGISDAEFRSRPKIPPGTVVQADLNGSPGWRLGRWRWLLASTKAGEVKYMRWKSPTKRKAASQPYPGQLPLEIPSGLEEIFQLMTVDAMNSDDSTTLVVAHGIDLDFGMPEFYLGRPKIRQRRRTAWHWCADILEDDGGSGQGPRNGGRGIPDSRTPDRIADIGVPDVPVRLRNKDIQENSAQNEG